MNVISSIAKMGKDDFERSTMVVGCQIANVFQHECLRFFLQQYFFDIEEKGALRLMFKPLFVANDGKGLARKPRKKNIKIGNVTGVYPAYIPKGVFAKICKVSFGGFNIPFRRKNAFSAEFLIGEANSPDACKEINKSKVANFWRGKGNLGSK